MRCDPVLYSFPDATTLSWGGIGIQGPALAPRADLDFISGNIDGQVVVSSLTGGGEYHPYYFTGCIEWPW